MKMTRFQALVLSYGAQLQRWPDSERSEAEALLAVSAQARRILDEAQVLDQALEYASDKWTSEGWQAEEQDAALANLRSGVASRIAHPPYARQVRVQADTSTLQTWVLRARALCHGGWGLATSGALAVAIGIFVGWMQAPGPEPVNVISMLESAPIHMLAQ
jgi:hypothetical protein